MPPPPCEVTAAFAFISYKSHDPGCFRSQSEATIMEKPSHWQPPPLSLRVQLISQNVDCELCLLWCSEGTQYERAGNDITPPTPPHPIALNSLLMRSGSRRLKAHTYVTVRAFWCRHLLQAVSNFTAGNDWFPLCVINQSIARNL